MIPATRRPRLHLAIALFVALLMWSFMFSPCTAGMTPLWGTMACAVLLLTFFALTGRPRCEKQAEEASAEASAAAPTGKPAGVPRPLQQIMIGIALALLLWGVFWVGDKVSSFLFPFARPQVDSIYSMKEGQSPWVIGLLLLFIIGPAEEFFWRGYVQRLLSERHGANLGYLLATAAYTLIHVGSLNFMLTMSALVCGVLWGGLYRLRPQWLPAIILSHALWDALVFVVLPI